MSDSVYKDNLNNEIDRIDRKELKELIRKVIREEMYKIQKELIANSPYEAFVEYSRSYSREEAKLQEAMSEKGFDVDRIAKVYKQEKEMRDSRRELDSKGLEND